MKPAYGSALCQTDSNSQVPFPTIAWHTQARRSSTEQPVHGHICAPPASTPVLGTPISCTWISGGKG